MKEICICELHLRYFKGAEKADYEFSSRINVVKGCNGIGKSTIADAISWVLFGTNQAGDTKFGIKTKDEHGNEIEDVEHSVEIRLCTRDDSDFLEGIPLWTGNHLLTRILTETRKKDGSVTNNYTYKVDGEVVTAGDFKKVVDGICPEKVFRLCSSPYAFVGMEWSEQRKMLNDMYGVPSVEDVTGGDARFDAVKELLEKEDIDKELKHLKYNRKEIQDKLDDVPVRLESLNKVVPKAEDWDAIEKQINDKGQEINKMRNSLNTINGGGADLVRKQQNINILNLDHKRKRMMEESAQRMLGDIIKANAEAKTACDKAVTEAEQTVEDLKKKVKSYDESINRCNTRISELNAEMADGAAKWNIIKARTWEWNEDDAFCPTCKQPLPEDQVQKIKEESEKAFLNNQAEDLKKLRNDATKIKEDVKACEKEIESFKLEQKTTQTQLDKAEAVLKEAQKALEEQEKKGNEKVSVETLLAEKPEYKQVYDRIEKVEAEQEKPTDEGMSEEDKKLKADLEKKIKDQEAELDALHARLSVRTQWDKVNEQIKAVKNDRKVWQEQLDELDDKIAAVSDYQKMACEAMENIVNKHFRLIKWSMFRRQLDGTDKPWCECSVDGVPYSDSNTAAKMNAGLDIARALKEYYQVNVPCMIDNAEAVLDPLYDGGQQIRLMVTEDKELTIERYGYKD